MKPVSLALIPVSSALGDLPQPLFLPFSATIRQISLLSASALIVNDSGGVWKCLSEQLWSPVQVNLPFKVRHLACNEEMCLMVTDLGKVFAWGKDSNETGVMGTAGLFASETPMPVQDLDTADIVQVAIGTSHAAALDSKLLFRFGAFICMGTWTFWATLRKYSIREQNPA
jgi:hypothetical protein